MTKNCSIIVLACDSFAIGEWWKVGFVMSVVKLVVWIAVALVWWKVLGYY
ncbi:anion permease [Moraxella bovoculi]|nr:anion permease [Moraxella bovoculi]